MKTKIDFAQNVNALGAPKGFEKVIIKNCDSFLSYPDPKWSDINNSLADFVGVDNKSISYLNGSTEAFFNLPKFINKKKALIVQPTFWEYEVSNKKSEKSIESFFLEEESKFNLDFSKLDKKIVSNSVVYLCNPNNPTGTLVGKTSFLKLIKKRKDTDFVVDETYLIFRHDYKNLSLAKEAQKNKNLYVVTSLSKIFALPGIRAGFMVSHKENISRYMEFKTPYDLSPINGILVQWLLRQGKFLSKTQKYYQNERKSFTRDLKQKLDGRLNVFDSEANYIFAKILTKQSSTDIANLLSKKGMIIRDGAELPYLDNRWIRFTIKSPKYNKMLMSALDKLLK